MDMSLRLATIKRILAEFSSAEYQDRVWVKGLGPQVSSYEEAVCSLLDDMMFENLANDQHQEVIFDAHQRAVFRKFIDALICFNASVPQSPKPSEIVRAEAWDTIRKLAGEALHAIN